MTSIIHRPTEEQMAACLRRAHLERSEAFARSGHRVWAAIRGAVRTVAHSRRPSLTGSSINAA